MGGNGSGPGVDISVVVPVYNCATCLVALHERVAAALEGLVPEWELILVDDRAGDGSWRVIEEIAARDPRVRAVRLSRNFGQHAAVTAGLARSRGHRVVVMDCDLQDPPEEIPRLYAKALEGHDIVFTRRSARRDSAARRLAARTYFRILNRMTGAGIDRAYGSFTIISRKVVDAYLAFKDRDRHYLFILYWLGFDHAAIEYDHHARHSGRSSYSVIALARHALSGIFFQTTVLLRWIMYVGFAFAATGTAAAIYLIAARIARTTYPGWTSVVVAVLITGGVIVMSTGIIGLYLGKMFEQVKERPLYVVDREVGAGDEAPAAAALERDLAR